jgi:diguanylate cyclase (GGDEF)-like protein
MPMPSTIPSGESINRRFRTIVTLLYVAVVGLVLWLFAYQWRGYGDAHEARKEFNVVTAALAAMADVSSERRPTVAVLMLNDPAHRWNDVQQAARHATDVHMAALGKALQDPGCQHCAALLPQWKLAQANLQEARRNLDAMRDGGHSDAQVVEGFRHLVSLIPPLSSMAQTSAMGVIRENADVQSYLFVARVSGLLREQAGLIAQQFAPALVSRRALTEQEAFDVAATFGKIDQLRQLLLPSIRLLPPDLQADYAAMDRRFFGEGLDLLDKLRQDTERRGGSNATLMQLSDQYGPLVVPINRFRDDALALASRTIDESLRWHLIYLLSSGIFAIALTGLLLVMLWRFREKVIRPFYEARRFILDIAAGNTAASLPAKHYGSEVAELFAALHVLKQNDLKRRHLELERQRLIGELQTMAETDPLTGLLNRRAFESRARVLLDDQRGSDPVVALMMLDIDHFKRVNDSYGHESGDKALVTLAALCRETVRADDIVARFGGEEFVILLRVQAQEQARALADQLRQHLHKEQITSTDGQVFGFTASFGIAFAQRKQGDTVDVQALLREADALLYRAKENGRDRIEVERKR